MKKQKNKKDHEKKLLAYLLHDPKLFWQLIKSVIALVTQLLAIIIFLAN